MDETQEEDPADDEVPAEQAVQPVEPDVLEKVVAGHTLHAVLFPNPYVPAGHWVQPETVLDGIQYVPAPQQTTWPESVHCANVVGGLQPVLHGTALPVESR